jgi:hypothetical protein
MDNTKLTIRVSKHRLEKAKLFARRKKTSLSRLVDEYLGQLAEDQQADASPLVRKLSGVLSPELGISDHQQHLEQKHLGKD